MECDQNNRCYITTYPDVHCTFSIMDRCNDNYEDDDLKKACINGARDAHLLSEAHEYKMYDDEKKKAYMTGNYTTFHDCLPSIDMNIIKIM
jgi:hypothetical protein